jgi:formate hydrogenlyase transcriptional activator
VERRIARFESADGGTLFLDEVGEMPAETQVALLRVLQEREFERVGGRQSIPVDVRVIAPTNCDLPVAVRSGKFRLDLFYRLNVFPIHVPPLRERPKDILLLAKYFIKRYAAKAGKRIRRVERRTAELLEGYHWPGNIRELQNVIERAVIFCDSDTFFVEQAWLQPEAKPRVRVQPALINQEREIIEAALAETGGRIAGSEGAARKLVVPRTTLESKIKSLRIDKYRYSQVVIVWRACRRLSRQRKGFVEILECLRGRPAVGHQRIGRSTGIGSALTTCTASRHVCPSAATKNTPGRKYSRIFRNI